MWQSEEFLLADLAHAVYIQLYVVFFIFDASPKKLFVSCHYYVLFFCLAPIVFKKNTTTIQYF